MTYPRVQFVAAPEVGAEVLFDFNQLPGSGAAVAWIEDGTFTLGAPTIEGDPDGLGIEYGPRMVEFTVVVDGTRSAALAIHSLLARTFLLRRRGWLRVQLDALTRPVWVRTYTPEPDELDFELILLEPDSDTWRIPVKVAAEPFIRGERIQLWSGTINNDPAAAVNPMGVLLPPVPGDAPAPLRISATFTQSRSACDLMWATSAVPDTMTKPIFVQVGHGDPFAAGADVSATDWSSTASGGSMRRCSFATTPGMALRLSGPVAGVPMGRYRVFLRTSRSGGESSNIRYRLAFAATAGSVTASPPSGAGPVVSWVRSANTAVQATWVDLGSFDLPYSRTDADIPVPSATAAPTLALYMERILGSSHTIADVFALVPESLAAVTTLEPWEQSSILVSSFPSTGPSTADPQMWDGDSESTFRMYGNGLPHAVISGPMAGQVPVVRPGVANLLTLFQQVRLVDPAAPAAINTDTVSDSAQVTASIQPRYLWLGDD